MKKKSTDNSEVVIVTSRCYSRWRQKQTGNKLSLLSIAVQNAYLTLTQTHMFSKIQWNSLTSVPSLSSSKLTNGYIQNPMCSYNVTIEC